MSMIALDTDPFWGCSPAREHIIKIYPRTATLETDPSTGYKKQLRMKVKWDEAQVDDLVWIPFWAKSTLFVVLKKSGIVGLGDAEGVPEMINMSFKRVTSDEGKSKAEWRVLF